MPPSSEDNELIAASQNGDVAKVKLLLAKDARLDVQNMLAALACSLMECMSHQRQDRPVKQMVKTPTPKGLTILLPL